MSTQNCSNCYNGCTEITSDKCVKYTGVDVPILGIKNGDSLSYVEQALITFLGSALDGTGIQPVVAPSDVCPVVQAYLDDCSPLSLNNYLTGIIKTICDLNEQIVNIESASGISPTGQSAPYNTECLTGVSDNTSTRNVLERTIVKLCDVEQSLNTFITDVTTNYVKIVDIDTYIANFLNNSPSQQLISNRMVPFAAVPYFGSLNVFDASGAGIGVWDRIFLCNGQNGTPDLRGRVPVGATSMGSTVMASEVDPAVSGNPAYDLNTTHGVNTITLSVAQIPAHVHADVVTATLNPASHSHQVATLGDSGSVVPPTSTTAVQSAFGTTQIGSYTLAGAVDTANVGLSSVVSQTIDVSVTAASTGGGLSHDNYQPGLGSYYIIFIP